jgi:hypothetical protein
VATPVFRFMSTACHAALMSPEEGGKSSVHHTPAPCGGSMAQGNNNRVQGASRGLCNSPEEKAVRLRCTVSPRRAQHSKFFIMFVCC